MQCVYAAHSDLSSRLAYLFAPSVSIPSNQANLPISCFSYLFAQTASQCATAARPLIGEAAIAILRAYEAGSLQAAIIRSFRFVRSKSVRASRLTAIKSSITLASNPPQSSACSSVKPASVQALVKAGDVNRTSLLRIAGACLVTCSIAKPDSRVVSCVLIWPS
jgi:hypothetical protein